MEDSNKNTAYLHNFTRHHLMLAEQLRIDHIDLIPT